MKALSYFVPQSIVQSSSPYNKSIAVVQMYGRNALLVSGIEQTGPYTEKLWKVGLQPILDIPPKEISTILVLGVGEGMLFHMFQKAFPVAKMTGVDVDPEIIRIGKKYFGLDAIPGLTLAAQDARAFVKNPSKRNSYDLVIVDLYTGNDVPPFVTQNPFLSGVRRLVRPGGRVVINYFCQENQDQKSQVILRKLSTIYRKAQSKPRLRNIFFYVVK